MKEPMMDSMKKPMMDSMKVKLLAALCAVLFLAGLAGSFLVLRGSPGTMVEILQDDEVLYTLDLSETEDQTIEVTWGEDTNVIAVKNHQIYMLEASCPDQICVNMGVLDSAVPITCLPNHLVIRYVDAEGETGLDGVSG